VLEKFDASILDQIPIVPVEKNLLLELILTEELLTQLPLLLKTKCPLPFSFSN